MFLLPVLLQSPLKCTLKSWITDKSTLLEIIAANDNMFYCDLGFLFSSEGQTFLISCNLLVYLTYMGAEKA